jgi:peroxiredoxin
MISKLFYTVLVCLLITAEVKSQSSSTPTLKTGDTIPEIELSTMDNLPFLLRADQKGQPLVIIFYRANWCPFCNAHLSDLQSYFKPLMKLGYKLIAISTESVENLKTTKENNFLKYTLLSDASRVGINKFGIVNGSVAVPSVFITDQAHVLKYVYTDKDYTKRLSVEEIYKQAEALKGK